MIIKNGICFVLFNYIYGMNGIKILVDKFWVLNLIDKKVI